MVEQNLRVLIKQECTKDWVRLLPWVLCLSRVSLDSVERINWNEEKDAPKEKINTEIVFTDLKSPP